MKRYLFFLAAFLVAQTAFGQGFFELIQKSTDFMDTLDRGKFEDAHSLFDENAKGKITPENLRSFWTDLTLRMGKFESVDGAQNKVQGEYSIVTLNCKFEKGLQSFQFAFDKNQKIAGFFVAPRSNTAIYAPPAYADTALYREKLVTMKSGTHDLAAMITTPAKGTGYPLVVLVHGSGPSDMDETIGPNKPFKDLAAGLGAKGIATVRYVKRTLVYPNDFAKIFTTREEVTDDALAAVELAKTVAGADKKQIYLLGHSLGGMLAPRIAALSPDLKGIILAAAPARKLTDIIIEQNKFLYSGIKDSTGEATKQLKEALSRLEITRITKLGSIAPDSVLSGLPASYWADINTYDQVAAAKKLKNRILVLQGGNDIQVSVTDYTIWKTALADRKNASFRLYPDINHLLAVQTEKGGFGQYQKPGNVADSLISDIAKWIKEK